MQRAAQLKWLESALDTSPVEVALRTGFKDLPDLSAQRAARQEEFKKIVRDVWYCLLFIVFVFWTLEDTCTKS